MNAIAKNGEEEVFPSRNRFSTRPGSQLGDTEVMQETSPAIFVRHSPTRPIAAIKGTDRVQLLGCSGAKEQKDKNYGHQIQVNRACRSFRGVLS